MTDQPTIIFYAIEAAAAEAELGLVSCHADDKFLIVEFWAEADQYEISGGFKTRAALDEALKGETFSWY
jgi:hypothetical protein